MAIQHYKEAVQSGYHSAILDLAAVHHWGLPGFRAQRNKAKHLYGVLLKIGKSYEKSLAKDRLRQMQEEEGTIIGNGITAAGGDISGGFSSNVFGSTPFHEQFMSFGESPEDIGKDDLTKGIDDKLLQKLINEDLHISKNRRPDDRIDDDDEIYSDPHNARDHMVNTTAKQSFERLRSNTHIQYDIPTVLKMIHQFITQESDLASHKKQNASKVIENMARNMNSVDYEGSKELEALQLVWNRIKTHYRSSKQRLNLSNNLVNELAECIEYGELVCTAGRVNRIIDSLNFIDPEVKIKPKWAIKQEMMYKAEQIRASMLKSTDGMTRDSLDATVPTAMQTKHIKTFMDKFQRELKRNFTKQYVDGGIMSKDLLYAELSQWFAI